VWDGRVSVPLRDTWLRDFPRVISRLHEDSRWLDKKPEGWSLPAWVSDVERTGELGAEFRAFSEADTVYGGSEGELVRLRITADYTTASWKAF
jgi:hypothetical protein